MTQNPYQAPSEVRQSPRPSEPTLSRDILLKGSMPVRDVLHTQLLVLSRRWVYALLCFAMYIGFVFACAMLNDSGSLFGSTFTVLGLMVMPAVLPFTLLMVYLRMLRDAKHQTGIFAVTETTLSQDGIQSKTNNKQARIPWNSFRSFLPSSRVILLFLRGSNNHLIVSRAKLENPEDWPLLLEFLHDRFPDARV